MTAVLLDTSKDNFVEVDGDMRRTMVSQIARMTLWAISGGRVTPIKHGIALPVAAGYTVTVELAAGDTYTVRRLYTRAGKVWLKGERTNVYCEELSEVAYFAHAFRSYDADEWPTKA